jgi:EspG family
VRGTTIVLSQEEYRTVWHCLGLGTRHWNMDLPGLAELTEDERRVRMSSTLKGLQARGLADRRGPAPEVEDALGLLANPLREINGSVHAGADRVRLLAGSRGDRAVLAMLDDHHLLYAPIRPPSCAAQSPANSRIDPLGRVRRCRCPRNCWRNRPTAGSRGSPGSSWKTG